MRNNMISNTSKSGIDGSTKLIQVLIEEYQNNIF